MPELPEVETTRLGISPHVIGAIISEIIIRRYDLRWPISPGLAELAGRVFVSVKRRSKYLLLETDGGEVVLETENRYIDRPIRGYDDVEEGDFAVLRVRDTGVGISADDLPRIFEPFYTKKVMGRSGTGLGMAVVWGTVKDHNAYIDVESELDRGSRFELYFPITRQKVAGRDHPLSLADFRGDETVLVVDDVPEQREIATEFLGRLGYRVTALASGEEAIAYLRDAKADLLVLDMIMDPGIDGLTTYKQILRFHPGQKAIIASGFSETENVKEAQRLGAGKYIKKPYTLEKLGWAVRSELDR